jgi:hypothetical protein
MQKARTRLIIAPSVRRGKRIRPQPRHKSLQDVEGVDLDLGASEIVAFVQEGRRDYEG